MVVFDGRSDIKRKNTYQADLHGFHPVLTEDTINESIEHGNDRYDLLRPFGGDL